MREENRSDEKEGGKFGESVLTKRFGFEAGGEEKSEQEQWRVVGNRRVRRIARIRTHPAVNVVRASRRSFADKCVPPGDSASVDARHVGSIQAVAVGPGTRGTAPGP